MYKKERYSYLVKAGLNTIKNFVMVYINELDPLSGKEGYEVEAINCESHSVEEKTVADSLMVAQDIAFDMLKKYSAMTGNPKIVCTVELSYEINIKEVINNEENRY